MPSRSDTPTPGDLSARRALLAFVNLAERRKSSLGGLSEEMEKCLQDGHTALSALPAAGGEYKTEWMVACGSGPHAYPRFDNEAAALARYAEEVSIPSYIHPTTMRKAQVLKITTISEDVTPSRTTPQPSAADDYESWAKQERQREDTATRLGSAAVGVQGDGDAVAELLAAARTASDAHEAERLHPIQANVHAANKAAGRLRTAIAGMESAAPAAGKGVDEVLAKLHGLARSINNEDVCHLNASADMLTILQEARFGRNRLEAALTRQPVAGDGCTHEWVSGDNKYVSNMLICQRCYEIKPAATPTDGEEGKS